jgi:DNA-binding protein HU-beta
VIACWLNLGLDAPRNDQVEWRVALPPNKTTKEYEMTAKPMTKTQLVAALAEKMDADKKTATAALDAVSELVMQEVSAGGAITLPGIGKIMCRARPERQVRNPATGETMTKAADKAVKVTIAKALKDAVNG